MIGHVPTIIIRDPDPAWAREYRDTAARLHAVLGAAVLGIDHIGSTSVPGLAAKDILDIQATVADEPTLDTAAAYAHFKTKAAALVDQADTGTYADLKDPVCDLVYLPAEDWAARTDWTC
jgi:GrpB-like predicted nucleotidyltransferase (UPF0157 family)